VYYKIFWKKSKRMRKYIECIYSGRKVTESMQLPNQWYAIALSSEIKKKPVRLERFSQSLVLWRDASGSVVVMANACPHRLSQLHLGTLQNNRISCPFHGFQFDASGQCQWVPELQKAAPGLRIPTYPVYESEGWIWIWWKDQPPSSKKPAWFETMGLSKKPSYRKTTWKTSMNRCIENQLDYSHLPFVHKNTIGKFAKPVHQLPKWTLDEHKIHWHFSDEEIPYIEFRFPNLWINRITKNYAITVVFVPVNEMTTEIYLNNHLPLLRIPILGAWAGWVLNLLNQKILQEDYRVVQTQKPLSSQKAQEETLFPSDRGISHFRKWLQQNEAH
jgi:phenylpropionate dioxygenase-like ring-hydroxylating dioxygenase large terminal subunit